MNPLFEPLGERLSSKADFLGHFSRHIFLAVIRKICYQHELSMKVTGEYEPNVFAPVKGVLLFENLFLIDYRENGWVMNFWRIQNMAIKQTYGP